MLPVIGNSIVFALAAVILFAAVMLIVVGVDAYVVARRNMTRRLMLQGELAPAADEPGAQPRLILEDDLLKRFADFLTPKRADELAAARKRLIRAGYRGPSAVRIYNFAKPVLGLICALAALTFLTAFGRGISAPVELLIALIAAATGFSLPFLWVERLVERRREEAEIAFPDMLDMLLICIEAGSGIDHAARRVAQEVANISRVLSDELGIVNSELWAGKERASVFRDFADRIGVPDISAFATVLKQSDEFGVSIAESLRVYASDMRLKRIMRAEEKANQMPVKVALGSIFFTVPPTMLIMAGPSLYTMLTFFGKH